MITLNPVAFGVEFNLNSNSELLDINDVLKIEEVNKKTNIEARSYSIENLVLSTVQYIYEENEMNESLDLVNGGNFTYSYLETRLYIF